MSKTIFIYALCFVIWGCTASAQEDTVDTVSAQECINLHAECKQKALSVNAKDEDALKDCQTFCEDAGVKISMRGCKHNDKNHTSLLDDVRGYYLKCANQLKDLKQTK